MTNATRVRPVLVNGGNSGDFTGNPGVIENPPLGAVICSIDLGCVCRGWSGVVTVWVAGLLRVCYGILPASPESMKTLSDTSSQKSFVKYSRKM